MSPWACEPRGADPGAARHRRVRPAIPENRIRGMSYNVVRGSDGIIIITIIIRVYTCLPTGDQDDDDDDDASARRAPPAGRRRRRGRIELVRTDSARGSRVPLNARSLRSLSRRFPSDRPVVVPAREIGQRVCVER